MTRQGEVQVPGQTWLSSVPMRELLTGAWISRSHPRGWATSSLLQAWREALGKGECALFSGAGLSTSSWILACGLGQICIVFAGPPACSRWQAVGLLGFQSHEPIPLFLSAIVSFWLLLCGTLTNITQSAKDCSWVCIFQFSKLGQSRGERLA